MTSVMAVVADMQHIAYYVGAALREWGDMVHVLSRSATPYTINACLTLAVGPLTHRRTNLPPTRLHGEPVLGIVRVAFYGSHAERISLRRTGSPCKHFKLLIKQ